MIKTNIRFFVDAKKNKLILSDEHKIILTNIFLTECKLVVQNLTREDQLEFADLFIQLADSADIPEELDDKIKTQLVKCNFNLDSDNSEKVFRLINYLRILLKLLEKTVPNFSTKGDSENVKFLMKYSPEDYYDYLFDKKEKLCILAESIKFVLSDIKSDNKWERFAFEQEKQEKTKLLVGSLKGVLAYCIMSLTTFLYPLTIAQQKLQKGISYYNKQDYKGALENFEGIAGLCLDYFTNLDNVDSYKKVYVIYSNLLLYTGLCYYKQEDYKKAKENFEDAISSFNLQEKKCDNEIQVCKHYIESCDEIIASLAPSLVMN